MSLKLQDTKRAESVIAIELAQNVNCTTLSNLTSEDKVADQVMEEIAGKVSILRPALCTVVICLGSYGFGTVVAWPSPAINDLNGHLNPLFITSDQSSWISSIMQLGGLFGALIGGPYSDKVGRKLAILSAQTILAAGWIVVAASANFGCMLAGRTITGFAVGALMANCTVFIGEISPAKIRGLLGSCHQLLFSIGIFMTYVFGAFTPWNYLAVYAICIALIQSVAVSFIPESPRWLLANDQKEAAEKSLKWLRGTDYDVRTELASMAQTIATDSQEKWSILELAKPELWKPLVISLLLMVFQQFSGINVILAFMVDIFQMVGSDIDPNTQSMAVGAVGIAGTLISVIALDYTGRRLMLTVSAIVMSISIGGMGAFFYEQHVKESYAEDSLSWLPLVCLIVFYIGYNSAFGPVPWIVMGEMFPQKAKGIAAGLSTVVNFLCAFLMAQFFGDMSDAMGTYGAYWFCCGFCVVAIPFSMFIVTETKGKTLEQIQEGFK